MTNKVVFDPVCMVIEFIVNVENCASGVAENMLYPFASQRLDQYARTTHFHCGLPRFLPDLMVVKIKRPRRAG
jgi:hypothetical protein